MELPLHSNKDGAGDAADGSSWSRPRIVTLTVAMLAPVIVPFIHIGLVSRLWDQYNFAVDDKTCTNSCWDTVFKGPYERGPGGYKHVYFNATSNSLKIWAVTVLAVILVYEATNKALRLLLRGQARLSMLVLLLLSAYPHYYSWWSYFNYWNDDFYHQWNHQLFFSITELASTLMVVHLMDRRVSISSRKCLLVSAIAILHILSSGLDQFVDNVVRGNGALHQVLRDVFFMGPDLLHVALPLFELHGVARSRGLPSAAYVVSSKEFVVTIAFICSLFVVCRLI